MALIVWKAWQSQGNLAELDLHLYSGSLLLEHSLSRVKDLYFTVHLTVVSPQDLEEPSFIRVMIFFKGLEVRIKFLVHMSLRHSFCSGVTIFFKMRTSSKIFHAVPLSNIYGFRFILTLNR